MSQRSNDEAVTTTTQTSSTTEKTYRWASLADRLNPNRAAYDSEFKAQWKLLSKAERKELVRQDQKDIRALKQRGKTPLPFLEEANEDDHCETSSIAYSHIAPILKFLEESTSSPSSSSLQIYDPYYCAGATVQHLQALGFENVYNRPEDCYEAWKSPNTIPTHSVVVTNPPYSGNHFDLLLEFLRKNGKPFCLLLPDHFVQRPCLQNNQEWVDASWTFLTPPERYHYWTPEGRRQAKDDDNNNNNKGDKKKNKKKKRKHSNLHLGTRNSPFNSLWFVCLDPVISRKKLLKAYKRGGIQLPPGCLLHKEYSAAKAAEPTFRPNSTKKNVTNGEKGAKRRRRSGKEDEQHS